MVNPEKFNLQGATALVPAFSGGTESDLVSFVAKCEFILNNTFDAIKHNILEAILAQLTGKALSAVRYKKITTWDELKKLFKTVFESAYSVSYL
ncbi:Retrovirus-related Pol polyprotein [Aphis craccivora]|uniref:Retrovirus-related Pol polyprotein n=1 Tax=Aphis craccivora TaxID=307492 RepID=A0A6G0VN05_APHCR|nr:Retrovirus-related Pol polyprotein [Aphis craccivora]